MMRRLAILILSCLAVAFAAQSCSDEPSGRPDVVFIGNSITAYWGKYHPAFFADNNIACKGISGQTTARIRDRFVTDVIDLKPKAVVIMAGINDLAQNEGWASPEEVFGMIRSLCMRARRAGIVPIIASITPAGSIYWRTELTGIPEAIAALNRRLRDYAAAAGIDYVDYHAALDTDGDGAIGAGLTDDGVHPLPDAYFIMEEAVMPHIAPYLSTDKTDRR